MIQNHNPPPKIPLRDIKNRRQVVGLKKFEINVRPHHSILLCFQRTLLFGFLIFIMDFVAFFTHMLTRWSTGVQNTLLTNNPTKTAHVGEASKETQNEIMKQSKSVS
uniref:Transmembrane protein n=1 Tax=Cacopsylla melanoneura TaxID=428564 RepID=A0A8D8VGJ3_9HEMI